MAVVVVVVVVVLHQVFIAGFCSSFASKHGPVNVLFVADCRVTVKGHNNWIAFCLLFQTFQML